MLVHSKQSYLGGRVQGFQWLGHGGRWRSHEEVLLCHLFGHTSRTAVTHTGNRIVDDGLVGIGHEGHGSTGRIHGAGANGGGFASGDDIGRIDDATGARFGGKGHGIAVAAVHGALCRVGLSQWSGGVGL